MSKSWKQGTGSRLEVLIARAVSGDEDAWTALQAVYLDRAQSIVQLEAGKALRAREELDDIVAAVHARVFQDLPKLEYQGDKAFFGWIATLARNVIRQRALHHRRQRRAQSPERLTRGGSHGGVRESVVPGQGPGPVTRADDADLKAKIQQHLPRLSPADQQVLALFFEYGDDMQAIARALGIEKPAAHMRWSRAKRRLARLILGDGAGP